MTKWPEFITKDLGSDDDAEMMRRWEAYNRDMKALIAKGGVHKDDDGWWVETATGELIGPDPEIERPNATLKGKPLSKVMPELHTAIKRSRGRPPVEAPKQQISIRLDQDVIQKFKAKGKGWHTLMNDVLKRAKI